MDKKYYTLEEMQKIKLKDNEFWVATGITQYELDTGIYRNDLQDKILVRYIIIEKENK
jgi:hypothetical protein